MRARERNVFKDDDDLEPGRRKAIPISLSLSLSLSYYEANSVWRKTVLAEGHDLEGID